MERRAGRAGGTVGRGGVSSDRSAREHAAERSGSGRCARLGAVRGASRDGVAHSRRPRNFRWLGTHSYGKLAGMKTTVELPDATFRQAKTLATARGVTLKRFFTEALDEHLRRCAGDIRAGRTEAPWTAGFGALSDLSDENRRILGLIDQEFETITSDDLACSSTPTPRRRGRRDRRPSGRSFGPLIDSSFRASFSASTTSALVIRPTELAMRNGCADTCPLPRSPRLPRPRPPPTPISAWG